MRICFLASDDQGGGRCRSFWPAAALRRLGWDTTASLRPPEPGSCDVLVVHRPLWGPILELIAEQQEAGTFVIVDEDDDLTQLPVGMRPLVSEDMLARHGAALEAADGVIVSTAPLAEVYGHGALVCRNFVDLSATNRRFYPSGPQPLRVGWTGIAKTHAHDLQWLRPVVDYALGGATLLHVGDTEAMRVLAYHGPREHYEWAETADAYYSLISRADIGIVPLDPSEPLNVGKSYVKALDFGIGGKPVVATRLPEQELYVSHGVSGFLADTPEEFASYTRELLQDADLRAKMGRAAKERAVALAETVPLQWAAALEELIGGKAVETEPVRAEGRGADVGRVGAASGG